MATTPQTQKPPGEMPPSVAVPNIPAFSSFFGSVTLREPRGGDWLSFDVLPMRRQGLGERLVESPAVRAWFPGGSEVEASGVIKKVRDLLRKIGHADSGDVAAALLGLFCVTDRQEREPVDHFNYLLTRLGLAEIEEHLVCAIPPFPGSRPYSIGEFSLARVDRPKLRYRCERVGCNYFELYPNHLKDGLAISRRHRQAPALEISKIGPARDVPDPLWRAIVDHYFTSTTTELRQRFLDDFRQAQEVLVAEGAPYLDTTEPMIWAGSSFISIFEYPGQRGGYFCPLMQGVTLDFLKRDQRVPEVAQRLKDDFGFDGQLSGEIGATLRSFCRFVTTAKSHRGRGSNNEAFLHLVIALDLVFGERSALTDTVAKRTAAVAGPGLGATFADARKRIEHIYDLRSRYVHEGTAVDERELDGLEDIVREVLHTLLRIHRRPASLEQGARHDWLQRLDLLVHTHLAKKEPTAEDTRGAGLGD
jgi:hypothetical protein